MKNNQQKAKSENKFLAKCKAFFGKIGAWCKKVALGFVAWCKKVVDSMCVDKDAKPRVVKPVVAWSILGGLLGVVAIIAILVFALI